MSKVWVDRELLERLDRMYMDGMSIYGECEELRATLAQPAEAEGVEVVAYAYIDETTEDYLRTKPFVLFARTDGSAPGPAIDRQRLEPLVRLAALSAVTAERDTLREQVKLLQSDAKSWQSGYDKGREDGATAANGWREQHARDSAELRRLCSERDAVKAERAQLRAENEGFSCLLREIGDGCARRDMPSEQTIAQWADRIDAAMAAKEGV